VHDVQGQAARLGTKGNANQWRELGTKGTILQNLLVVFPGLGESATDECNVAVVPIDVFHSRS